jgi:hypothetical protein
MLRRLGMSCLSFVSLAIPAHLTLLFMFISNAIYSLACPYVLMDRDHNACRNRRPYITRAVSNIHWQSFGSFYQLTHSTEFCIYYHKETSLSWTSLIFKTPIKKMYHRFLFFHLCIMLVVHTDLIRICTTTTQKGTKLHSYYEIFIFVTFVPVSMTESFLSSKLKRHLFSFISFIT